MLIDAHWAQLASAGSIARDSAPRQVLQLPVAARSAERLRLHIFLFHGCVCPQVLRISTSLEHLEVPHAR
jgi:hypothetical protein